MAHLDPTKIHIASHAGPAWETEVTFQDLMAEQLRHAPWFILRNGFRMFEHTFRGCRLKNLMGIEEHRAFERYRELRAKERIYV